MSATTAAGDAASGGSKVFAFLQKFGRSLMLPIAVLPAAALLLRFGQPDMLGAEGLGAHATWLLPVAKVFAAAGQVLFDNLALLFAVGVAIGMAKKADGSTALAAVVGYLVFDRVTKAMFSESRIREQVLVNVLNADGSNSLKLDLGVQNPTGVLGGILIGVVAGLLWQKYHRIKLPSWLSFFGGRRFVPIVTALSAMLLGVVFGWIWPVVGGWIASFGDWVTANGVIGAGIYGVVNRLLLPMGLHHIINSIVWFTIPACDVNGVVAHGDLNCYFAGQQGAGTFMAGWFPVLMFGIPGAALAIWRAARPANRAVVGGLMVSGALTAFICGITEPIEYSFIFVAPLLFGIHVVLSGLALGLATALNIKIGFGFSAGLIDYLLNFSKENTHKPLLLLLIGLVYFVVYFLVFYVVITKMNLPTPGREVEDEDEKENRALHRLEHAQFRRRIEAVRHQPRDRDQRPVRPPSPDGVHVRIGAVAHQEVVQALPVAERETREVVHRVPRARLGPVDHPGDLVTLHEDVGDLKVPVREHRRPRPQHGLGDLPVAGDEIGGEQVARLQPGALLVEPFGDLVEPLARPVRHRRVVQRPDDGTGRRPRGRRRGRRLTETAQRGPTYRGEREHGGLVPQHLGGGDGDDAHHLGLGFETRRIGVDLEEDVSDAKGRALFMGDDDLNLCHVGIMEGR